MDAAQESQPKFEGDFERYGRKIAKFLPFVHKWADELNRRMADKPLSVEEVMAAALPALVKAFDCEVAFYADQDLKIRAAAPPDRLSVDQLPKTDAVQALFKDDETIVLRSPDKGEPPVELQELGLRSVLIACLETPTHEKYAIGVGNPKDANEFLGEEKTMLELFAEVIELGIRAGYAAAELWYRCRSYLHAHRRGDHDFLSRASEDLALQLRQAKQEAADARLHDMVLADYLDHSLCEAMLSLRTGDTDETAARLAKLFDCKPDDQEPEWQHTVIYAEHTSRKNGSVPVLLAQQLDANKYPRTRHAKERIWTWLLHRPTRVPGVTRPAREPRWRRCKAKPRQKRPESKISCVDCLRTCWQEVYFLAHEGLLHLERELVDCLNILCAGVWDCTRRVLGAYLGTDARSGKLRVDSDWLLVWLTYNTLCSKSMAEHYGLRKRGYPCDRRFDVEGVSRFMLHFSQLLLYSLYCVRHPWRRKELKSIFDEVIRRDFGGKFEPPRPEFADVPADLSPDLSQALLYVLTQYAYWEIGVDRQIPLFELLREQPRVELSLHATSERYRDHLYHVCDVCLLGELLLRSRLPHATSDTTGQDLATWLARKYLEDYASASDTGDALDARRQKLLQNWYVAALCHDLGYVIEGAESLLSPLDAMRGPGLHQFASEVKSGVDRGRAAMLHELEEILKDLSPCAGDGNLSVEKLGSVRATDHGIASWLYMRGLLQQMGVDVQKYAPALCAMLRHNLANQEVDVRKEPLTFLLVLCDHLQEWGRPRMAPYALARAVLEPPRFGYSPALSARHTTRRLTIRGLRWPASPIARDQALVAEYSEQGLEFSLDYCEAREAGLEPALSWLLLTRDLQCFSPSYSHNPIFPGGLCISMHHPTPRWWGLMPGPQLEMELLQAFADEKQPYLYGWIAAARKGEQGVKYTGHVTGEEEFHINLQKLGKPLPRGLDNKVCQEFQKWKWAWFAQRLAFLSLGTIFPETEAFT